MGSLSDGLDKGAAIFYGLILLILGIVVGDAIWNALSPVLAGAVASAQDAIGPATAGGILLGVILPLIAIISVAGTAIALVDYAKELE